MIEKKKVEEIILKHKKCRTGHKIIGADSEIYYVSCLIMVLAKVRGESPYYVAKELCVI